MRARTIRYMAHIARTHISRLLFRRKYSIPRSFRRTARYPHHPRDLDPLRRRCRNPSVPALGKPHPRPCAQPGTQHDAMAHRLISPLHRGSPPPRVRPIPIPHHSHRRTHNRVGTMGKRPRAQARRPHIRARHRAPIHRTSDTHTSLPRSPGSHLGHRDSRLRLPTHRDDPPLITPQRITRHRSRLVGSPLDSGRLTPPHPQPSHARPTHPRDLLRPHAISTNSYPRYYIASASRGSKLSHGPRRSRPQTSSSTTYSPDSSSLPKSHGTATTPSRGNNLPHSLTRTWHLCASASPTGILSGHN